MRKEWRGPDGWLHENPRSRALKVWGLAGNIKEKVRLANSWAAPQTYRVGSSETVDSSLWLNEPSR